jgi:hypothetical protein
MMAHNATMTRELNASGLAPAAFARRSSQHAICKTKSPDEERCRRPGQCPDEVGQIAAQSGQIRTRVVVSRERHRHHPPKLTALSVDDGACAESPPARLME